MKKIPILKSFGLSLTALALVGFLNSAQAQFTPNVDSWTQPFDTSGSTGGWVQWWGWGMTFAQNPSVYNPATAGNAGCAEIVIPSYDPFPSGAQNNENFFYSFDGNAWGGSVSINANYYTNVMFDILVSSNDVVNSTGTFGQFTIGFWTAGWFVNAGTVTIPAAASNHWVHIVLPISKTLAGDISNVQGITLQQSAYWSTDPTMPPLTGVTYWIDNLEVQITPGPPPPPPTILGATLQKAVPGVDCIATAAGNTGNRYSICTTNTVGYGPRAGHTVTYTWNIKQFANDPDGFQSHFFISCGTTSSLTPNSNGGPGPYDSAVDWNWGNVIRVTVQANADGAYMNFRYKTNTPGGNGSLFTTNWTVNASSPIGQWSVSINKDSGLVTLTSPQNTTNFTMDADSLALFTDPLALTLGGSPNDLTGDGLSVVYSSFSATGCATPITDNFATDTTLNTNIWFALTVDTNGVQFVPPTAGLWLSWTRPDTGFSPQGSTSLSSAFTDITPITTLISMGNRMTLIPSANVGANQSFYRLIQRKFTKLQILLPGETAAPNTPSGKTGTPIAQSANNAFDVIVNACDDNWIVVSSTDTINLTSTDGNFYVLNTPADLPLAGGTATFSVEFLGDGSSTITATDVTDGSKTAATSATVTY